MVLVARTSAMGLWSAQGAMRQWASGALPGHVRLLGLVVVADTPGRLPRPLRELLSLISGGLPQVWELPWVEALRLGDPPWEVKLPGAYATLAEELRQKAGGSQNA